MRRTSILFTTLFLFSGTVNATALKCVTRLNGLQAVFEFASGYREYESKYQRSRIRETSFFNLTVTNGKEGTEKIGRGCQPVRGSKDFWECQDLDHQKITFSFSRKQSLLSQVQVIGYLSGEFMTLKLDCLPGNGL